MVTSRTPVRLQPRPPQPAADFIAPNPVPAPPNLVVNGNARAGLTGWTTAHSGNGAVTATNGEFVFTAGGGTNRARLRQGFATVPGQLYRLSHGGTYVTNNYGTSVGTTLGGSEISSAVVRGSLLFFARSTTTYIGFATDINARVTNVRCERVDHTNFMMTNGFMGSQHLQIYDRPELAPLLDTDGVQIVINWRQIEPTTAGTYDFALMDSAVNYAKARGKSVIFRLQVKTYTDPNSPPQQNIWPQYILDNAATYGGESPTGGLARQLTNRGGGGGYYEFVGWSLQLNNAAVRDRLVAMVTALMARYATEGYVLGLCLDEVLPNMTNQLNNSVAPYYPYGITEQQLYDGYRDYIARAKTAVGGKQLWVCCNYWENPDSVTRAKLLAEYTASLGGRVALTDVFYPGHPQQGPQPTYPEYSVQPLAGLACVDFADYHGPDDLLRLRCERMALQSRWLGSLITSWYAREVRTDATLTDPRYWTAAKRTFNLNYPSR